MVTELGIPQTDNDLGTSHSKWQGYTYWLIGGEINSQKMSWEMYLQTHCILLSVLKPLNEIS